MVSPDEINQFFQNLTPEQQQKAQASGAYQEALATGNIAPLQPYLAAPSSSMTVEDAPPLQQYTHPSYEEQGSPYFPQSEGTVRVVRRTPEGSYVFSQGTEIGQSTVDEEIRQGRLVPKSPVEFEGFTLPAPGSTQINPDDPRVIKAAPPQLWSGGVSVEDLPFKERLKEKYEVGGGLPGLYENRLSYSQARSYMANLSRDPTSSAYISTQQMMNKERQAETEYAAWVAMGKPPLVPDEFTPPLGGFTFAQWDALTGLDRGAFAPGTTGLSGLRPDFVKTFVPGGKTVDTYATPERIAAALGGGEGAWGGGEPKSVSMQTGEEWGRQKAAEWGGAPAPGPAPAPDTVFPSGLADTEIKRAALGNMFGLGAPVAEGFADTDIKMAAIRQNLAMGGMSVPLAEIARPVREAPLGSSPAGGFQGTDIPLTTGLATLRGFGEVPIPAMERVPQAGGSAQQSAVGMDVGSFYYPFAGLGVLGREVQRAGEGFASYLGRAGKTWIEEVGGIRPEPMPLPSEISADAKKYMEGGITKTETFAIPYSKDDPINRLRESMGLEQIKEAVHTRGTYTPYVDAEVTVRGEAGKGGKETFTEMLAGPPDPFRYITNIGPVKLPFNIGPIGRNEKVPLASEAYKLRAAPGVFTREVGSAVGLGIVKPVGQAISALENPMQAGMAAPGVALAFGVGLAMLPGQIAMTTILNPAAGAGQVYGLVAPFSLAGKLRGARFDAKPAEANIQFPSSGEGGVLLEVPKRGPIAGHVDLGGVVASRIMGRPISSTVQVGEGGVFEIPLEWIDRPVVGGKAVSAEGLLRGLEIERRFSVELTQGRTAEMQVPGNIEMRGSMRAWNKGVGGFHAWLNKAGAEGLADFHPTNLKFVQDSPLLKKGELGAIVFRKGQSYTETQDLIIASEQFPSLRGWDARLDNPQFAKVYWEAESREMINTIGHEFRHSIQPFYYKWQYGKYEKTKGLREYDAERFAETARAAWEAEVDPAAPERVYINRNLEPEVGTVANVKEELVATIPRSAETVDVFRLGRMGEAKVEMEGELFIPAGREGAGFVRGAPEGLFQPVYETVKTAEPWMKGTRDLPTYEETRWTDLGESPSFREWKVSPDYPIVRPQTLLEKITRRPAEEVKLVESKTLLGYQATMGQGLSEYLLGRTAPKGTVARPSSIKLTTFEPLEGLTPKEIGAEATYGARGAPANLGLTEGAKGEPVYLGGIGAREKAVYTLGPKDFGLAPKALEKFGLKSSLKGERLEVEFGGVKGQPSLYDTPVGMKAVGGTINIRPGLAKQARGQARGLLERIREKVPARGPRSINYPGEHIGKKVKIPGPGDRRGSIFDYVEADRQETARGKAAMRAGDVSGDISRGFPGMPIGSTPSMAGPQTTAPSGGGVMRGATLSDVYGEPKGSQTVGEALQNVRFPDMTKRPKKYRLVEGEEEGVGLLGLQTEIGPQLAKMKSGGFRFYSAPGSRSTLRMPRASLRGASLGLGAGALSLRGKIGTSEVMVGTQRESTRLLDVLAERTRPIQDLRMPGVLEHERTREDVSLRRLEREKTTQGVGQIQRVDQRQQVRVTQKVGTTQITSEIQVPKLRVPPELEVPRTPPSTPPGRPGQPPPGFLIPRLGGFAMPRGSFRGYRPSLKITPIATLESMFSFGGGSKRGGRKASRATGAKRGRPKGSKTKKRGGKR